jgi:hypothetical protein
MVTFANVDIARQHGVNAFVQLDVAEGGIARDPLPDQLLEFARQWHGLASIIRVAALL